MKPKDRLRYVGLFVAVLYAVWALDFILPWDLTNLGLHPRTLAGLLGIFTAPFLHAGIWHLVSNTLPLLILLGILVTFFPKKSVTVIGITVVVGGLGVWIFGRDAVHVGASGLIYGLAAFLIANGVLERKTKSLLIAVFVAVMYFGLVWGLFPTRWYISWEGHLFGAAAGVLSAYVLNNKGNGQD